MVALLASGLGSSAACDYVRGEALIVVDTDMPVPKIVSELRVDIYSADGSTWWTSRDIPRLLPEQWPVSFSVYSDDMSADHWALVRLRAFPQGYVQDYAGEGYVPRGPFGAGQFDACCSADCLSLCPRYWSSGGPRLLVSTDGGSSDETPVTEPQPLVTIDRMFLVHLIPGTRGKIAVTLAGACDGTQAILPDPARANPAPADLQTCVDTEGTLVPVSELPIDPDMTLPTSSIQGQLEAAYDGDCASTPRAGDASLHDAEVCIRGGAMILGGDDSVTGRDAENLPARVAVVPSFVIDQFEFSVARLRYALSHGFKGAQFFVTNNGSANTPPEGATSNCTYSATDLGRDTEALNCVVVSTAQDLCAFYGGSLPLEVQWEYAATVGGRPVKSFDTYAPGPGGAPDCADVAFARGSLKGSSDLCSSVAPHPFGVAAVDGSSIKATAGFVSDTTPTGLIGLAGNVTEYTQDAFASRRANCALAAPMLLPQCQHALTDVVARGASWKDSALHTSTALRTAAHQASRYGGVGFRCVR